MLDVRPAIGLPVPARPIGASCNIGTDRDLLCHFIAAAEAWRKRGECKILHR